MNMMRLNRLQNLFHETKCKYLTTNTSRLTLESIFPAINSIRFGKKNFFQRLLERMFREKPLLPRSLVTFGVKTIFEYIAEFARYDETSLDYVQKL